MNSTSTTWLGIRLQIFCSVVVVLCLLSVSVADDAKSSEEEFRSKTPEAAQNIGVDDKTGNVVPMNLMFRDTGGTLVELGTVFDGTQPVMLSFNYSNCPKLCSTQLENMTLSLREVAKELKVGDDFQVVSISIDPNEQTVRLRETENKYIKLYNQKGTEDGWNFMTGDLQSIKQLTDICGFRYRYIARQKFYSHPPVFILLSPEGKVVRYIHGLDYDPQTIKQALIESAEGKIGSPINWLSYGLGCYVFDEATGQYTFQAMAIMRSGAVLTVILLVVSLAPYWFFSKKARSNKRKESDDDQSLVHSVV